MICDSLNSVIISKYYDSVISYNLNNGDKNYNISTRQYTTHMDISKNNKYFLIADRTNVYVHNSKTGALLTKLSNYDVILSAVFYKNKYIVTNNSNGGYI